jgi:hypothetical protein
VPHGASERRRRSCCGFSTVAGYGYRRFGRADDDITSRLHPHAAASPARTVAMALTGSLA